ncbi:unnamed protein product [Caenorhabditis bovis]|uniref:Uncharacterized protein n=1 Tax=Caenorhabditis bovis TaxID=2654633 RepID=A0A8S1F4M6_9PELO|nr:unnamed protein product [Caenorhabditis bovis]
MSDNDDQVPEVEVDYSKFDEDSVPMEERPIEKKHEGRPDLDYDETPVGPAPEVAAELEEEQEEKKND